MTIIEHSDGIPDPGPANSVWIECMVDGCTVAWDVTPPEIDANTLAGVFGAGVMQKVGYAQHAEGVEFTLNRHLSQHSALQWAKTVNRLKSQVDQLQDAIAQLAPDRLWPV